MIKRTLTIVSADINIINSVGEIELINKEFYCKSPTPKNVLKAARKYGEVESVPHFTVDDVRFEISEEDFLIHANKID